MGLRTSLFVVGATCFLCALAETALPKDASAAAEVKLEGPARSLPPDFLGFSVSNAFSFHKAKAGVGLWTDPSTAATLKALSASVVRFLGGQESNYWNWRAGWIQDGFTAAERKDYPVHGKPSFSSPGQSPDLNDTLDNFKTLVSNGGNPTPLFDINVMTHDGKVVTPETRGQNLNAMIDDQMAFLKAAQAEGLPIKYIELGNEFYWGSSSPGARDHATGAQLVSDDQYRAYPNGADYGEAMKSWIKAIHKDFPEAKTAIVLAPKVRRGNKERLDAWNNSVLAAHTGADASSFHPYAAVPDFEFGDRPEAILAGAFRAWDEDFAPVIREAKAAGLATWVTEFNMIDRSPEKTYGREWVAGLFISHMMVKFLSDPAVDMVNFYDMMNTIEKVGDKLVGADGTAVYFDADGKEYFSPTGQALAIIGGAVKGATRVTTLKISGAVAPIAIKGGQRAYSYPAAEGLMVEQPSARHVLLINYSAEPITFDLSQLSSVKELPYRETANADISAIVYGHPLTPTCAQDAAAKTIILPAYSLSDLSSVQPVGCDPDKKL